MKRFAQLISYIFQPLLFPTYSILLLFQAGNFAFFDFRYKLYTTFSIFVLTAIIPFIVVLLLKRMGVVSSILLNERNERTIPYIFAIFSYIAAVIFLYQIYMPLYIVTLMAGVLISTISIMLINFKWKVSAHLSAIGGLCAAIMVVSYRLAINPILLLSGAFLIGGIIASSRMILKAHTLMQTLSGFFIGFTVMLFFGMLF